MRCSSTSPFTSSAKRLLIISGGTFPGPKARKPHLLGERLHRAVGGLADVVRRHLEREDFLRGGFVDVRGDHRIPSGRVVRTLDLVREEGLEPPRVAPRDPKSRASANSATPAARAAKSSTRVAEVERFAASTPGAGR